MKLTLTTLISAFFLSNSAYADTLHHPTTCPTVSALKNAGLDFVRHDTHHAAYWNGAVARNKYDTAEEWSFNIGIFTGRNETEAMSNGLLAISSFTSVYGPVELMGATQTHPGIWSCWYHNEDRSVEGMALMPPQNVNRR